MNNEDQFAPVIVPEKFSRPSPAPADNEFNSDKPVVPQDMLRRGMRIAIWSSIILTAILVANDFFTALFVKMIMG